jgi:hypothetical protein
MHRQILAGLERSDADFVFLCENDVLYHPSHFEFTPPTHDIFFYNVNVWKVFFDNGRANWTDDLQQLSGLCADRYLLLEFYQRRIAEIESKGFDRHYEPQPKTGCKADNWKSEWPNIDIRHDKTWTKTKRFVTQFRNKRYAKGWKEASFVEGWGYTEGRFLEFLKEIQ